MLSIPSDDVIFIVPPSICVTVVPCIPSLAALMLNVPSLMYIQPVVSSSSSSLWNASFDEFISKFPSYTDIESLASMLSFTDVMLYVPPVIFISSLQEIPLFDELITSVPVPLSTRSSLEKITASVFVSPSDVNVPVTVSVFVLSVVVTKHLSADTTYITGKLSFVTVRPSRTSCIFASLSASTFTVKLLALPVIT